MKQGKRKSGRFSDGAKAPVKPGQGLDWVAIREARNARLDEEVARGLEGEEHKVHTMGLSEEEAEKYALARVTSQAYNPKRKGPGKAAAKKGGQKKGPRIDVDKLRELYIDQNLAPKLIAQEMGLHYETVVRHLKKQGIFEVDKHRKYNKYGQGRPIRDKSSYTRQTVCGRGHDQTLPGAVREQRKPNGNLGGVVCLECQKYNAAKNWRRKAIDKFQATDGPVSLRNYLMYQAYLSGDEVFAAEAKAIVNEKLARIDRKPNEVKEKEFWMKLHAWGGLG